MRLPIIKQLVELSEGKDENYLLDTAERLEEISAFDRLKDEELDVIGEFISNIYGAVEVRKAILEGSSGTDALNAFMKRVQGSIDR